MLFGGLYTSGWYHSASMTYRNKSATGLPSNKIGHLSNCGVGGVFGQMMIYYQTNGDTMTRSFDN